MNTELTPEQKQGLQEIGDKLRELFNVDTIRTNVGEDGQDFVNNQYTVVISFKVNRE